MMQEATDPAVEMQITIPEGRFLDFKYSWEWKVPGTENTPLVSFKRQILYTLDRARETSCFLLFSLFMLS